MGERAQSVPGAEWWMRSWQGHVSFQKYNTQTGTPTWKRRHAANRRDPNKLLELNFSFVEVKVLEELYCLPPHGPDSQPWHNTSRASKRRKDYFSWTTGLMYSFATVQPTAHTSHPRPFNSLIKQHINKLSKAFKWASEPAGRRGPFWLRLLTVGKRAVIFRMT